MSGIRLCPSRPSRRSRRSHSRVGSRPDRKSAQAKPGGLPVTIAPADGKQGVEDGTTARITVLGQKAAQQAGITGVLLTAEADHAGRAEIAVDYSGFASAVGGGWSSRLRLVRLPACVLDTPEKAACRTATPIASDNDVTDAPSPPPSR